MKIALIAHDKKKSEIIELAKKYKDVLAKYELYATGDADTMITKIYIGEGENEPVCVAEANVYRDTSVTDIKNFRILWQKYATEYTVYLDDVSLIRSDKAFVSSTSND